MRYLQLYRAFVLNCLARAMEFRAQFVAGIVGYLIWAGVSLLFIEAVFGSVGEVRGWSKASMWVLYGTYVTLESLCYGLLGPNMFRFSTLVREGELDLALTKPVNTQFYVSARYIDPNGVLNAIPGLALLVFGLHRLGLHPSLWQWLLWLALLLCGLVMAYCIWFFCVTWAIWAIKMESISVIFDPMMQVSRFPVQIYPRRVQPFLIVGLPVAFLTTYPTEALLGRGHFSLLLGALALASTMLWLTHLFFQFALRFYSSASS